jgi:uncharacterized cupredoxin-like copper-binding protein
MKTVAAVLLAAGLAVMPLGGAGAVDWSKAQKITVVTTEYKFTPNSLTFHKGIAYRLHLDNKGKEAHEFTAPAFFKAIEMRDARPLNTDQTEIVIQPGQKKDLYFVPNTPGTYDLRCSDHDWAGMTGGITIAP